MLIHSQVQIYMSIRPNSKDHSHAQKFTHIFARETIYCKDTAMCEFSKFEHNIPGRFLS